MAKAAAGTVMKPAAHNTYFSLWLTAQFQAAVEKFFFTVFPIGLAF